MASIAWKVSRRAAYVSMPSRAIRNRRPSSIKLKAASYWRGTHCQALINLIAKQSVSLEQSWEACVRQRGAGYIDVIG